MLAFLLTVTGAAGAGVLTQTQTVRADGLPPKPIAKPDPNAAAKRNAAFVKWRTDFRARALKDGISPATFDSTLKNVLPDPEVERLNDYQPEFTRLIWEYLDGALSEKRVARGREMLKQHGPLLKQIETQYKVDAHYIVAIWGLETTYGALMGSHNVFKALATLGYRGRRQDYGESQLLSALHIVERGDKQAEAMKGSWAGAMGHTQFVPSTYLAYALDQDGDGRRDLWDSLPDVFGSTAHYLRESGWQEGESWGREIVLPENFDYALAGYHVSKPLSQWRDLGVRLVEGPLLPVSPREASVLVPGGHRGPAILVYDNFRAILAYNRSTYYALGISLLADTLAGRQGLKGGWPRELKALTKDEQRSLQDLLSKAGYNPGPVDGIIGMRTRQAIRAFQSQNGQPADGFATKQLLAELNKAARQQQTASPQN